MSRAPKFDVKSFFPHPRPSSSSFDLLLLSTSSHHHQPQNTTARFPSVSTRERSIVTWLVLTALIHLVVEGYVVLDSGFYRSKSKINFLAEVWKEYGKADSRYATRDAFTVCMEFVTAFFVGPLCLFAASQYCSRGQWRHVAALVASVCQLYGDALYFATCAFEKGIHTRPEPLYFWFYFVGLNGMWVVVPLAVSWHAIKETLAAQKRLDESGWRVKQS